MNAKQVSGKRLFVLDTNILMHDPTALFRFKEHDIFLPMIVIEELDNHKKGNSEVARNARQSSRFLDELMQDATPKDIESGLSLNPSSLTFRSFWTEIRTVFSLPASSISTPSNTVRAFPFSSNLFPKAFLK